MKSDLSPTETHSPAERSSWFTQRAGPLQSVAYFSPEFGLTEKLPQYAGGLGILAGDHLKAAGDLGVPLVGVGLFYSEGYFTQSIDDQGGQQETYVQMSPEALGLKEVPNVRITLDLKGESCRARVWETWLAGVQLLLLDSNLEENEEPARAITKRLYGGGSEYRLRQEFLLGIGGVQMLLAMGLEPEVFHLNEGHAGFSTLERIRLCMSARRVGFHDALGIVRENTAFTTHTPVPEGIDVFGFDLMGQYFGPWAAESGIDLNELMDIGRKPGAEDAGFNMAVMCLRLAARSNGVSKLHGAVSRLMFKDLWPDKAEDEIPIGSITNGIHLQTWGPPEVIEIISPSAFDNVDPDWSKISELDDEHLWGLRGTARSRLRELAPNLNDSILTIGFARRFAPYKRPTLLLSQPERLKALLLNPDRPVQLIVAGKAHPADELGKALLQQVAGFACDPALENRVCLIPDYDIGVARILVRGVDVWLNNPRRPLEACGTSGMKAVLGGALNVSIPDGWWDEMYDGKNGWKIEPALEIQDQGERDWTEANRLFELLEGHVVPEFYDRTDGLPRTWIARVKHSMASLGPQISAHRMVAEYVEEIYEPLAANVRAVR